MIERTRAPLRLLVACMGAATLVGAAGPAVGADEDSGRRGSSLQQDGTCIEALVSTSVETERVRPYVPDSFTIVERDGRTALRAWAADCDISVDRRPPEPGFAGGIFVEVEGPSEVLISTFSLTWITGSPEIFRRWQRLGHGELVPEATFDSKHPAGVIAEARGEVPGGALPFSLTATALDPDPGRLGLRATAYHWKEGRRGLVRGTYPHDFHTIGAGIGEIRAAPGSPLAHIMGGERGTGEALFVRFDYTGIVEFLDGTEPPAKRREGAVQRSEVFRAEPGPDHGSAVEGSAATLRRVEGPKAGRLAFTLSTTGLNPGHAYTVWTSVHNRPEHCTGIAKIPGGTRCGEMDWAVPAADATTFLGAGAVAAEDGSAVFGGQLQEGDRRVHFAHEEGRAFTNVRGGDVVLWVRDHGPHDPDRYGDEQLTTFNGGCLNYLPGGSGDAPGDYPCSNQQVASFGGLE